MFLAQPVTRCGPASSSTLWSAPDVKVGAVLTRRTETRTRDPSVAPPAVMAYGNETSPTKSAGALYWTRSPTCCARPRSGEPTERIEIRSPSASLSFASTSIVTVPPAGTETRSSTARGARSACGGGGSVGGGSSGSSGWGAGGFDGGSTSNSGGASSIVDGDPALGRPTRTDTVARAVPPCPSAATYTKLVAPSNPRLGIQWIKSPTTRARPPPALDTDLIESRSPSGSESFARTSMTTPSPCFVLTVSSRATGMSFTGSTVITTVPD